MSVILLHDMDIYNILNDSVMLLYFFDFVTHLRPKKYRKAPKSSGDHLNASQGEAKGGRFRTAESAKSPLVVENKWIYFLHSKISSRRGISLSGTLQVLLLLRFLLYRPYRHCHRSPIAGKALCKLLPDV